MFLSKLVCTGLTDTDFKENQQIAPSSLMMFWNSLHFIFEFPELEGNVTRSGISTTGSINLICFRQLKYKTNYQLIKNVNRKIHFPCSCSCTDPRSCSLRCVNTFSESVVMLMDGFLAVTDVLEPQRLFFPAAFPGSTSPIPPSVVAGGVLLPEGRFKSHFKCQKINMLSVFTEHMERIAKNNRNQKYSASAH